MPSNDQSLDLLLELGNPAARRNRAGQMEQAMRLALALTDADAVVVRTPASRSGKRLALHAHSVATATLGPSPRVSEIVQALVKSCQPLLFPNLADEPRFAGVDDCPGVQAGPAMFLPLRQRDPTPGYFAIYRGPGRAPFTTSDMRQMLLLTTWLSTALENLRLSSGVERLSVTDDLTDIYNARFLVTALGREIRRAGRFGQETSIVRLEIDRFEAFKEERGELNGSVLLKDMAALLVQGIRSYDLIARYEDDRFILILPQTGREGAVDMAERLRVAVESHAFPHSQAGGVTASLGVACFPADGADATALLASSERVLRYARERGMNRVQTLVPPRSGIGSTWGVSRRTRTGSTG